MLFPPDILSGFPEFERSHEPTAPLLLLRLTGFCGQMCLLLLGAGAAGRGGVGEPAPTELAHDGRSTRLAQEAKVKGVDEVRRKARPLCFS